jgi:branched-chain amino acid transport system substrate-binding protein
MRRTDRDTLVGRVTFDAKGDNPHFLQRMGQHQNGRIVIVWPPEAATEKMNFPGVPW